MLNALIFETCLHNLGILILFEIRNSKLFSLWHFAFFFNIISPRVHATDELVTWNFNTMENTFSWAGKGGFFATVAGMTVAIVMLFVLYPAAVSAAAPDASYVSLFSDDFGTGTGSSLLQAHDSQWNTAGWDATIGSLNSSEEVVGNSG